LANLDFNSFGEYETAGAVQKPLLRLFTFIFFIFIMVLYLVYNFIEHGRIIIMVIIIFPLILMIAGIVIGLSINISRDR